MRRLGALLVLLALAACAGQGPWFKFAPPDQDPGKRAGSRSGTTVGPNVDIKGD